LRSVVAEAAAGYQSAFAMRLLRPHTPKLKQAGIRAAVGPRDDALALIGFFIERFEPPRRITFGKELASQFACAFSVDHIVHFTVLG
jgi:hypothetical protein